MDPNNTFSYFNKIFSLSVKDIKDFLKRNVLSVSVVNLPEKQAVSIDNLNKLIDEIKSAVAKKTDGEVSAQAKEIVVNQATGGKVSFKIDEKRLFEALDSVKREIQNNRIEIPDYPDHISFDEASDVISVLEQVVAGIKELQRKELKTEKIDLSTVERELINLKSFIPKIPDLKLPMEKGRIKVILPDDQVIPKTTLGEKVKKVTGQFLGGTTKNPYVQIHGPAGSVISPATEGTLNSIKDAVEAKGTIGDGTTDIPAAGTAVQLSTTSVPCKRVLIYAHESNGGTVVVGSSTVVAALVGRRGIPLFPTQGVVLNVSNLNLIYVDTTNNGDDVHYYYEV